jgi:hypothetical protein
MHVGFVRDEVALERHFPSVSHRSSNDAYSYITTQPSGSGKTEYEAAGRLHDHSPSYFDNKEKDYRTIASMSTY